MPRHIRVVVVGAMLLAGGTAAWSQSSRPSVTVSPAGAFVWHDLVTPNPDAARAFYGALFGWTFEEGKGVDPGYIIIKHEGRQIGGIVRPRSEGIPAQWLTYVVVNDVDQAAAAVKKGGGSVFRGPLDARKDLRVAVVTDPQGAPLGIANRGPAIEEEGVPAVHRWLWMDYVARDPDAALKFYGDVIGFTNQAQQARENFTYYLLSSDRPRAGLFRSLWDKDTSAWLPYVRVADAAASAARAMELGGRVALPAGPSVRNGSLAIVLDPQGAPLALQRFPFAGGTQ